MTRREVLLRKLQDLECRHLVRLHLPATAAELLRLKEVRRRCPKLLLEFYAMTNGLEGDGVALWSVGGSLSARDGEDGVVPIGCLDRPCGRGALYLTTNGEVQCHTGEAVLQWKDLTAFLTEVL